MIFKVQFGKQIHLVNSADKQIIDQFLAALPTVFKSLPNRYTLSYLDEDGDEITLKDQSDYKVLLSSRLKTVRITIHESNEEFIDVTNQVQFEEPRIEVIEEEISAIKLVEDSILPEPHKIEEKPAKEEAMAEEHPEPQIDDSMIEQKLRKMLPFLVSKIKNQISEEIRDRSRNSANRSQQNESFIVQESIIKERKQMKDQRVVHSRVNCDGCGQNGIVGIRYKCAICPDFDFCQRCQATIEHTHPFLKIKTLKQTPIKIIAVIDDEEDSLEINGQRTGIPACLNHLLNQGFDIVESYLSNQNSQMKVERPKQEEKPVIKEEKIIEEPKEERKEMKPEPERIEPEVSYQQLLRKANHLYQTFEDIPLEKCLRYAQEFPKFTQEQLLNYCLQQRAFFDKSK